MTLVILTEGDAMFGDERDTGSADPTQNEPSPHFRDPVVHPEKPSDEELRRRFSYQPPDEERAEKHGQVDRMMYEVARRLRDLTPGGRAQALALTALEEARMRANQALAIGAED